MLDQVAGYPAMIQGAARATLLAALLLGPLPLQAATQNARATAVLKARSGVKNDLSILATHRPKKCIEAKESQAKVPGWRQSAAQCAWQNRLQMRRWEAHKDSAPNSCLSQPALWWAWARRAAPTAAAVAWNSTWSAQSLLDDSGAQKRVGIIERTAQGAWVATEWRWAPSPRAATRKWQERRWKLLTDVAMQMRQAPRAEHGPPQAALLKAAWEKNLGGRAAEVAPESWRWERDGLCLRMEAVGLSQAQLHLPYSKEDGRFEQRAAMQLRLARLYPKALWITQFRLLPLPDSPAASGAKYEAIWMEDATLKGQLWMPGKADGAVLRARINAALPAKKDPAADAAAIAAIARAIDDELIGLATIWARDNER